MPRETKDHNESAFKHLFGHSVLKKISTSIHEVYPAFDKKYFLSLFSKLEPLEMKSRVHLLRDELRKLLPQDCATAFKILLASTRKGELQGFSIWPYTEYVQTYGLEKPDLSLKVLKELTPLFTSEWAVRPFIKRYPEKALAFLLNCTQDKNVHVRRWASEGTRPRLPWGERLQEFITHPQHTFAILDSLKWDPELYVRKSVANHLNDITKDHPDVVIKILKRWKKETNADDAKKIDWITRHAIRTLIKNGHPDAFKLLGMSAAKVDLCHFKIQKTKVKQGDRLDFDIEIQSTSSKDQKLVIDYIVHFVKANQKTAPKVFKLKSLILPANQKIKISKSHSLKKITTRNYHPGKHSLEIQINGAIMDKKNWILE